MISQADKLHSDALTGLVNDHAAGVFRYLRSLVGDEEAARDLLQDTFLKLRPRAQGAGQALVYTVARNCAIDHLRRRRLRRAHTSAADFHLVGEQVGSDRDRPDRNLERSALRDDLLDALAELPEDQRTVFHLSEVEGLAYAEIAEILDVSAGTIASRKHHAVRKLRTLLRRQGHDR